MLNCWSIFAEEGVSDELVMYVAAMSAQLLDNDEDGSVDDPDLEYASGIYEGNIALFVEEGNDAMEHWDEYGDGGAVLFVSEINPSGIKWEDATFEEVIHNINAIQEQHLYPAEIGHSPDLPVPSELRLAMDIARGGYFEDVPNNYPADAWYTYDDETCDYHGCQLTEYLYWGIGTYLGYFEDDDICDSLSQEWKICSASELQQIDEKLYAIVTNPKLKFPSQKPDDKYCPAPTPGIIYNIIHSL